MAIKRGADLYRGEGRRANAYAIIDLFRERGDYIADPPSDTTAGTPVVAVVNHGRWLADCGLWDSTQSRNCPNAQLVDEDDPRFYCVVCLNDDNTNQWRDVTWPADSAAVEATLEGLPTNEQNWIP